MIMVKDIVGQYDEGLRTFEETVRVLLEEFEDSWLKDVIRRPEFTEEINRVMRRRSIDSVLNKKRG